MADWESQRVDRTSMADLMQMITQMQSMGAKQESYRRAGVENMYNEFSKGAGSFDNIEVQNSLNDMEQYYAENSSTQSGSIGYQTVTFTARTTSNGSATFLDSCILGASFTTYFSSSPLATFSS